MGVRLAERRVALGCARKVERRRDDRYRDCVSSLGRSGPAVVVIQARTSSTRLPQKVLRPVAGRRVIEHVLSRAVAIPGVDGVVVAVPDGPSDSELVDIIESSGMADVARGSEEDVLDRTYKAALAVGAAVVVRVTSDCPMFDPAISGAVLSTFRSLKLPYARTTISTGFPRGFDTEVVAVEALGIAAREASDPYEREHVTPYIWRNPERFPAAHLGCVPDRAGWRLTVDTPEDLQLAAEIFTELGTGPPYFGVVELAALFERRPDLLEINRDVPPTPYVGVPHGL